MKPRTKKICLFGIGLVFLFAMVVLPVGVAIAIRPSLLPDLGPSAGIPTIDSSELFIGIDNGVLGWDGPIGSGADFTLEPK